MGWRGSREASRHRLSTLYDAAEVERYESLVGDLSPEDEDAYRSDLERVTSFRPGMRVLDVGAGTGALTRLLARIEGLSITALEAAPAMLERLIAKPELRRVIAIEGFCDAPEDRLRFDEGSFDAIVSRQLVNTLFDPLAAFENWSHWLVPGGVVVVIDGLYGRSAWTGAWAGEIDALPLSACQTTALVPYLLESCGYRIETVEPMTAANARPSTRTTRYVVVARKPDAV